MKSIFAALVGIVVLVGVFPVSLFAQTVSSSCSSTGYSVLTINGIFNEEEDAQKNLRALRGKLGPVFNGEEIIYDYLYNPTHLSGLGDLTEVLFQKTFESFISGNYDLKTIQNDLSAKLSTQKVFFVAHSQGNLYVNELYDEVVGEDKIPAQSTGVYGVASPATYVAGGGKYITSDTDKMILGLVYDKIHWPILPPNAHIEFDPTVSENGHGFAGVYIAYEGQRIIREIEEGLSLIKTNTYQKEDAPCLPAPTLGVVYQASNAFYTVADPLASVAVKTPRAIYTTADTAHTLASGAVSNVFLTFETGTRVVGTTGGRTLYTSARYVADKEKEIGLTLGVETHSALAEVKDASTKAVTQIVDSGTTLFGRITAILPGKDTPQPVATRALLASPATLPQPTSSAPVFFGPFLPALPASPAQTDVLTSLTPALHALAPTTPLLPAPPRSTPSLAPMGTPTVSDTAALIAELTARLLDARLALERLAAMLPVAPPAPAPTRSFAGSFAYSAPAPSLPPAPLPESPASETDDSTESASTTATTTDPLPQDPDPDTDTASTTPPETDTTPPAPPIVTAPATDIVTTTEVTLRGFGEEGSTLLLSWSEDDISSVLLVPVPLLPDHDPALPLRLSEWETTLTLTPGAHLFVLALRDTVGNLSDPTLLSFAVQIPDTSATPVPLSPGNLIITEVSFDPADAYIELYNPTNAPVTLDGGLVELAPFDGTFILLAGTVLPRSFVLIAPEGRYPERNTLARDIPMTALTDGVTILASLTERVDHLPQCSNWCSRAGEGMVIERFSYTLPTNDHFGNWGAPLPLLLSPGASGTPGTRNTLNYLLTMDGTITGHITPDPDLYIVNNNMVTVEPASSLTLLAGTTLLFSGEDAKLVSHGTLRATGTADLPVSITSSSQDTPLITDTSCAERNVDMTLYGTVAISDTDLSCLEFALWIQNATATITDTTVSDATIGIFVLNSTSTLRNVTVRDVSYQGVHIEASATTTIASTTVTNVTDGNGISISGTTALLEDIVVTDTPKGVGIDLSFATATIDDLTLAQNGHGGVSLWGSTATITDAVMTGGWTAGIRLGASSTLHVASSSISGFAYGILSRHSTTTGEGLTLSGVLSAVQAEMDSSVLIHDSTITGRVGVTTNLEPYAPDLVDMTGNYWGHPDGPTLPDDTETKGSTVPDGVLVDPYLSEPPLPSPEVPTAHEGEGE